MRTRWEYEGNTIASRQHRASNTHATRLRLACSARVGARRQEDFGFVPGCAEARDCYFPWLTAQSQPPAVARYSVPLATTGEAQIRDPRLILSKTSSVLPAFNIQRYFAVGM
jgi:hypothetical protein